MDKEKTKKIIKILVIVAVIIGITIVVSNTINALFFQHEEGLVYRTNTGKCYHSPGCGYLWNSAIPMGIEQAKASSLRICSRCGSEPNGTLIVNNFPAAYCITILLEIGVLILVAYLKSKASNETVSNVNTISAKTSTSVAPSAPVPIEVKPVVRVRIGSIVKHLHLGEGEVVAIEKEYITVKFDSPLFKTYNERLKMFQYPAAFDKYLELVEY